MRLNVSPDASDDGSLCSFWFYDEETFQGVSLVRDLAHDRIEVMIPDQNCYALEYAKIEFSESFFKIKMPDGTVDPKEGYDHYIVEFEQLDKQRFFDLLRILKKIIGENLNIKLNET